MKTALVFRSQATKVLTILAALAIWITGAYPPWKLTYAARGESFHGQVISTPLANDWLLTEKSLLGQNWRGDLRAGLGCSVDFGRLAVEWAIIAALYAASLVAFRSAPPDDSAR
jgi:hypothetical protein